MKRDNINYFSVGLFVIGMFTLLLVTLFALTGKGGASVSYFVRYNNIAGIIKGSTVTVNGYKVGRVIDIKPFINQDASGYELELAVQQDWPIPVDSRAQIITPGLLSEKQIDISPGNSTKFLAPDDHITSIKEVDLMVAMNDVAREISDLADKSVKPLVKKLGTTIDNIGDNIDGRLPQLTEKMNTLLTSLNTSADRFNALLSETNKTHIDNFFANVDSVSAEITGLKNDIDIFLKNTHQLINENRENIHKSVVDIADSSELLNNHLNTILYHLEETSQNLNELTRALRDNPGLILRGTKRDDAEEEQQ